MLLDISSETLRQSSMLCRSTRRIAFLRLVSSGPAEEFKHLLAAENSVCTYALKAIPVLNALFLSSSFPTVSDSPATVLAQQFAMVIAFTRIPHALAICRCTPCLINLGSLNRVTSWLHGAVTQPCSTS
ncbi:hypothetical protein ANAPH2_01466 [Anaplasma phagocytophilum]|nr:hypothetical protein ANAPH2_01466 [Anaplasma phagocytophilum]